MPLKNLEETIVDRIQRALAKELKRLRRKSRSLGNGQVTSRALSSQAEAMARGSAVREAGGGTA
jgi:hypothetical protein